VSASSYSTSERGAWPSQRFWSAVVTNVGTTPAEVSIQFLNIGGDRVVPDSDHCASVGAVVQGGTCFAIAPNNQAVSCVIRSSSRNVRGALEVQHINTALFDPAVPATAK